MLETMNEVKVLRDPIHGYIHVRLNVVWECINSAPMQRLKRIRQLGGAFQVYHTAEHSRFSHSLGVYEITRRMVEEIQDLRQGLSEEEKVTVMLAGLLHDLGHGPFSHAFESVTMTHHEQMTRRIILEPSEVHDALVRCDPSLPEKVASVIDHTHPNPVLSQMISGQLDADRMDYLLRDAYFTGTKYGEFDLERILRTLRVRQGKLVVKESGMHSVEDYIMARYHMYWQVYFHPVSRSFEAMLTSLFCRLKQMARQDHPDLKRLPFLIPFLSDEPVSVQDHFLMDEPACNYGFNCLRMSEDPIASDLAGRLLDRRLFQDEALSEKGQRERLRCLLMEQGWDPEYYLLSDEVRQRPYQPYQGMENSMAWVLMETGEIRELSQASEIVEALVQGQSRNDQRLYYPRQLQRY